MAWATKKRALAGAALLVLVIATLMSLLHCLGASSPGRSKAADGLSIVVERIANGDATAEFKFKNVPPPSKNSAAKSATFSLATGGRDLNGGGVGQLQRGSLPRGPDAPRQNFFFSDGSFGGRVLVDLNRVLDLQQVNTYSWHTGARGPQLYKLFASLGAPDDLNSAPDASSDLLASGWKLLASVDTRPKMGEAGGQYGVSITSRRGSIGYYRYLLFDCKRTEEMDRWGNTFYSKIDVIGNELAAP